MTIAGLYLSPEGVVLGADSTSSYPCDTGMHFFDFTQKVFEIGEGSTLAMLTWGLGGLGSVSYRTMIAELADEFAAVAPTSVGDAAQRWAAKFSAVYAAFDLTVRCRALGTLTPHDPAAPGALGARTQDEEIEFASLHQNLFVGFCVAGYVLPNRTPQAVTVTFDPMAAAPTVQPLADHSTLSWWGVPNIVSRLIFGADNNLLHAINASGKWGGTPDELKAIVNAQALISAASLPIRDAIDYVHSCIHCTIKAMKFSNLPQVCGGPIEIAVITSDRKFRWVRHKPWDAAITDGAL